MTACLGDETIAAMLEGGLSEEVAARARAHLGHCDGCRRLVSAAVADDGPEAPPSLSKTFRESVVPGAILDGKYRIERLLGEGGMGRVYAARQLGLERPVAIKVLRPDLVKEDAALRRFRREARLVASLVSERVVRVHDLGELASGEPYLVMELLEGQDLASMLERGPLPIDRAIGYVLAAAEALAEAHDVGMVHRDIKPSNLFVARGDRLKVLDFGLAKLAQPSMHGATTTNVTEVGQILGSPRYMAPEQILGARDVDARADIWSLGATLYHLATGVPPFPEPDLPRVFASILEGRMPSLATLRPDVASVIHRCLARDPAHRFQNVRELASALRAPIEPTLSIERAPSAFPAPRPSGGTPAYFGPPLAPVAPPLARPKSHTGLVVALALVAVLGLLILIPSAVGFLIWSKTGTAPGPGVGPSSPALSAPAGRLAMLDETRLKSRLERLGWQVSWTKSFSSGTCEVLQMGFGRGQETGWNLALFTCATRAFAVAENTRLTKNLGSSWVIQDADRVLSVSLADEAKSRTLAEQLASGP